FGIALLGKEEELEVDEERLAFAFALTLVTLLLEYRTFDLLSMIDKHSRDDVALKIRDEDTDEVSL
nr:hypothetical protein [Tanacetum cinerariifolium]